VALPQLIEKGVYAIELRPVITRASFDLPTWCRQWSMNHQQVAGYAADPSAFDGSRTLNLFEFLDSLWAAMVDQYKPELGRLYFYFNK